MDVIDTLAWLRPDGRLVHTPPGELPPDGDGLWLYRPRDPTRPPVLIRLARAPDGAVRIVVAEVGRAPTAATVLHVHHPLIGPPVDTATALAAAVAWADRPERAPAP